MNAQPRTPLDMADLQPDEMGAHLHGIEDAAEIAKEAPQPLFRSLPPALPFPVNALGETLAKAARAIETTIQCPMACAANSVLAVAALAAQGRANVILPIGEGKAAPLSLYLLTVLESGERKSSADCMALRPVREVEARLAEKTKAERREYENAFAAYETHKKHLLVQHKKDRAALEQALGKLGQPPQPPLQPIIAPSGDQTMEGLFRVYQEGLPSLAMLCDDAATFLGGYSLKGEQKQASTGNLCRAWDGSKLERIRGGDGVTVLYDRRLAAHLMVQPGVASGFLSDEQYADQGLLARFLIAAPAGRAGTRFRDDTAYRANAAIAGTQLAKYNNAITQLLSQPVRWRDPEDRKLGVELDALNFTPEARALYVEFANAIERELVPMGTLANVKAFASKLPENAARIAGTLALIENSAANVIGHETLAKAVELAQFYLEEFRRLVATGAIDLELRNAESLRLWLKERSGNTVSLTQIYQLGPNSLRQANAARAAMAVLESHGWATRIEGGAIIDGKNCREAWEIVRC